MEYCEFTQTRLATYRITEIETVLNLPSVCPTDEPTDVCLVGERGLIHRVGANVYRVTVFRKSGDFVSDCGPNRCYKMFKDIGFDPTRQLEFVAKHASNHIF